jgi:hypothetical protein
MAASAKRKKKAYSEARPDQSRSLMQRLAELERALAEAQAPKPRQAKAA